MVLIKRAFYNAGKFQKQTLASPTQIPKTGRSLNNELGLGHVKTLTPYDLNGREM